MRRVSAAAILAMTLVALIVPGTAASASGPVGSPPGNGHILSPGQVPSTCAPGEGYTAYGVSFGYYWSDDSHAWIQAPWCYPRWGYLAMSGSQVVSAGDVVTATLIPDMGDLGNYIEAHFGAMDWSHPGGPGDVVAGCGAFEMFCTVRVGHANNAPAEWQWSLFHVSGPGRVFWLPISYAPRCQPCIDTETQAWSYVGVRPATSNPTADFTYTVDGGTVDFHATSTDPANSVLFHEWDFDDGSTGTGTIPSHTYTKSGTYHVTLTSTNTSHRSDSITKDVTVVGQPLKITNLTLDPPHPAMSDGFVKVSVELTNLDDRPLTGVQPTLDATPSGVMGLRPGDVSPSTDLPALGVTTLDAYLELRSPGEATIHVAASANTPDGPTSAPQVQLATEVTGGDFYTTLKVVDRVRTETGGTAVVEATMHNVTHGDLDGILPILSAGDADVLISAPAGVASTLSDGDSTTAVYQLEVGTTDKVTLELNATARRVSDGNIVTAQTQFLDFALDSPIITSVVAEPTGDATGNAQGDYTVTVTGNGLKHVNSAEFDGGDTSRRVDVHVESDTTVTLTAPDVSDLLHHDGTAEPVFDADLVLVAEPTPGDPVASNALPFRFEGPIIESVVAETTGKDVASARGNELVTVTGRNLDGVNIALFVTGRDGETGEPLAVRRISDTQLELLTPDMTKFLQIAAGGHLVLDTYFAVAYHEDRPAPLDAVLSNLVPFTFEGPVVDSIAGPYDDAAASAFGGDTVTVKGRNFTGVTDGFFSVDNGPPIPVDTVDVISDSEIEFVAPKMTRFLKPTGGGWMAVDMSFSVYYTADNPAPLDVVGSNKTPFTFEGPIIESVKVDGLPSSTARANSSSQTITVTGRNLMGTTAAAFAGWDNKDRLVTLTGRYYSSPSVQWEVDFSPPDARQYLKPQADGSQTFVTKLVLGYKDDAAPNGQVASNFVPFDFHEKAPDASATTDDNGDPAASGSPGGGANAGAIVGGLVAAGAAAAGGGSAIRRRARPAG